MDEFDVDGSLAIQNARLHGDAVFSEGVAPVACAAAAFL
jgi:hypothetical protein